MARVSRVNQIIGRLITDLTDHHYVWCHTEGRFDMVTDREPTLPGLVGLTLLATWDKEWFVWIQLQLKDILGSEAAAAAAGAPDTAIGWAPLLVGFLASFLVGCAACKWMLAIVRKGKLVWFAIYCLIVGLICIAKNYGLF